MSAPSRPRRAFPPSRPAEASMARARAKSSRPAHSCSRFTPATFIAVLASSVRLLRIQGACRASAPLAGPSASRSWQAMRLPYKLSNRYGCRYPGLDTVVLQTELAEERDVGIGGGVVGGEKFVAVEDRIRTGEETKSLAFAGNSGAPGGEPDPCARKRNAGDGD